MIILGSSVNDARVTLSENITTPVAVADPYDARIHFTQGLLLFPPLARCITDPHFSGRDRMGRLSAFMARQVKDGFAAPDVLGVGVDDGAALAIDKNGLGRRLAASDGPAVFVVRGAAPEVAAAGMPLVYRGLHVVKLASGADSFDFTLRCGNGAAQDFDVDGTAAPPYAPSVYQSSATRDVCPP
jgi:cyanophycinase-like exopeptidase